VHVEVAPWLSVVVRSGPFRTAVNGTLVARPSRMTPSTGRAVGSTLTVGRGPSLETTASWARAGGLAPVRSGDSKVPLRAHPSRHIVLEGGQHLVHEGGHGVHQRMGIGQCWVADAQPLVVGRRQAQGGAFLVLVAPLLPVERPEQRAPRIIYDPPSLVMPSSGRSPATVLVAGLPGTGSRRPSRSMRSSRRARRWQRGPPRYCTPPRP